MEKPAQVKELTFKWGKKRETNVEEKKDVLFYESFTYGDSEYFLYDCVSVCNSTEPESSEFFVGKIINIWEHNDQRQNPRKIELLWFFKPSDISLHLNGVEDVLANELFLASGTGIGLTNENLLETIFGKCYVLCTSKDARNPQPSDEEIKSAEFLFHRTFDVGTCKISEEIDDNIAGVDVKYIFNRASCVKKAIALQKVASDIHGTADSLKPNLPSTGGSVRQKEHNASDLSGQRKSDYTECCKQLASRKFKLAQERPYKDYDRRDGELHCYNSSGSRRNDWNVHKDQEKEVRRQMTKQKSRFAEEICSPDSNCSDDLPRKKQKLFGGSVAVSDGRTKMSQKLSHDGRKDLKIIRKDMMVEKSRFAEERWSKASYSMDGMPPRKRNLDDIVAASDGRAKDSQKIIYDSRKDIYPIGSSRDKVTAGEASSKQPNFSDKRQDLRKPKFSEGKETKPATEKILLEKPNFGGNISERTEGKTLTNANYRRHYQVFEVTQKPDAEESKWYRNLPWEEDLRCAEGQGNLVLLQNLNPTYTSSEVEDIVYSALNEQCTARMIEQTAASIPHIGEALVIFKTADAAKRVIRRLYEGCLLLPNRRTLVASIAKVNPPAKPPSLFIGHIKPRTQIRRGKRDAAVATSHSSQTNTIEFDMAMEWCLHRDRFELTMKRIFERQIEEKKKLQRKNLEPKHA